MSAGQHTALESAKVHLQPRFLPKLVRPLLDIAQGAQGFLDIRA
jgi:hypothetical protein